MFRDPIVESFRLPSDDGGFKGEVTLAYPSKQHCIALGLLNVGKVTTKLLRAIKRRAKERGRTELYYYREIKGKSIKKVYKL